LTYRRLLLIPWLSALSNHGGSGQYACAYPNSITKPMNDPPGTMA
jgi:hypothetical protein